VEHRENSTQSEHNQPIKRKEPPTLRSPKGSLDIWLWYSVSQIGKTMLSLQQYDMLWALLRPSLMTRCQITSSPHGDTQYYPIAPTPRKPYPFQLHLRDYNNQFLGPPRVLPLCSYLRAEEHVVSLEMLVVLEGDFGDHLMLKNESVNKLVSALKAMRRNIIVAIKLHYAKIRRQEGHTCVIFR